MNSKTLLEKCSVNYQRANVYFRRFLHEHSFAKTINPDTEIPFSIYRGFLYSFFQKHSLLVAVNPYFTSDKRKWSYTIYFEGEEILKKDFSEREIAEWSAFDKAFQYLDTKLFLEDIKDRFYDYKSDTCPCNINWNHLANVLNYRRKNINFC